ncbi:MAG: DJ-1/PfpI family protein [candidate division WOR-3 bacterium]
MKQFLILGALFIIFCGSGKEQKVIVQKAEGPVLSSKSVLIVIAHKDFRDEEFKEPFELLKNAGFKVAVASTDTTPAKGMLGMVAKPEILLSDVIPDSFNAIIIAGGTGCKNLWDDKELHRIVQNFHQNNKVIAAICIAPVVLARAGVLKNKRATVYPAVANEIKPYCSEYTGNDIEISDNIITGSGPQAAKDFAKAILEAISK